MIPLFLSFFVGSASADTLGTATLWNATVAENGLQATSMTGDVNGDGLDDLISFRRDEWGAAGHGDVYVAVSTGTALRSEARWHSNMCIGSEVCAVGDFNRDGRADVLAFTHDASKDVYVALSTGSSFGASARWHDNFGGATDVMGVGDMDGDGYDDIVSMRPGSTSVWISHADGRSFTRHVSWSSTLSRDVRNTQVADVNGDGRADLVGFNQSGAGSVSVAINNGAGFNTPSVWATGFCASGEVCFAKDMDRDGQSDAVSFNKSTGAVRAVYSKNSGFGSLATLRTSFCTGRQSCLLGDVNGDNATDAIQLYHLDAARRGDAWAALGNSSRTRTWSLDLNDMRVSDAQEETLLSDGDEPYLLVMPFRSRVATPGSTVVTWGGYLAELSSGADDGAMLSIPDAMGRAVLAQVTRVEADPMALPGGLAWLPSQMPEVVGAIVVAMESDASSWGDVDDLAEDLRQASEVAIRDLIENLDLAALLSADDPDAWLQQEAESAIAAVRDEVVPTGFDAFAFWARAWTDPDDLIDVQTIIHVAADAGLPSDDRLMGIARDVTFSSTAELTFAGDGATYGLRGTWTCR